MPNTTIQNPWIQEFGDYIGLVVRISVQWNATTRALTSAIVHRDSGCQYHTIVFDIPSDALKAKRLAAPADGQADRTYTATQMAAQGLSTIDDLLAVQITAEP